MVIDNIFNRLLDKKVSRKDILIRIAVMVSATIVIIFSFIQKVNVE